MIELRQVSHRFGEHQVLRDVSVTLAERRVAVVGALAVGQPAQGRGDALAEQGMIVGDDDTVLTLGGAGSPEPANFFIQDGSRLQGQSEHVANLQLGWEDDKARSQATFIVNYVSERITARGAGTGASREPDFVQEPGVFLDFVYRKDFTVMDRDLGFALELRNLLGTDFDEYQELGNKIRINNYELGQSASVSLTARF